MEKIIVEGIDNYGKPRQDFADRISTLSDSDLEREAEKIIWLSAFAANNNRSDYHWQTTVLYQECGRRGNVHIYTRAYESARATC